MRAGSRLPVNFQALPSRFSNAIATSRASPSATSPSATTKSTRGRATHAATGADRARDGADVDGRALEFAAGDLRQLQHVVDQLRHLLCRFADIGEILLAVVVELVAVILQQRQAEAVDAAQRRAQIVRHRIAEGFELLVLRFQLADQRRARFGGFARGARLRRLHFRAQELLADAPVFVLELLAANLRQHARAQQVEVARFGDVVVGAGAQPLDHRFALFERGQHDDGMSRMPGASLMRRQVSWPPMPGISRSSRMQSTGCTASSSSASSPERASTTS